MSNMRSDDGSPMNSHDNSFAMLDVKNLNDPEILDPRKKIRAKNT